MMIKPSLEEVRKYDQDFDVIPVYKECLADVITPITLLRKIAGQSKRCFLLESIEGGEKWSRYSFLGFDPKARVYYKNGVVKIEGEGAGEIKTKDPYSVLRAYMQNYKTPSFADIPPLTGGLVGYYGYRMIAAAEPVLQLEDSGINDFDLMLFDKVIAYDHLKQKLTVIVNMKTTDLENQYARACADIEKICRMIESADTPRKSFVKEPVEFQSNLSEKDFCRMVEKTKKYIYEGDIFQCVVSRRFEASYSNSLLNAYRVLRTTNPSPYMVYLVIDDMEIMSASPETLVKLQNGILHTFPIAGSRPRGESREEDQALEKELMQDEKELAEHNMLVDLGRNDIGKISEPNSVQVTEYQKVLKYSKIMHICSEVEGRLKQGLDAFDAVRALLPAGTLSGAPKIRACEIIEELEPVPRGVYGGAVGYVDFNGNMDTCIGIRMAVKKGGKVYVQAGAGIVADSIPEKEYAETQNKAAAVIYALQQAGEAEFV